MFLALSLRIKESLYPFVLILQMTPVIILAPIFVLWLGQGLPSIVAITFMICFFPIVANTTMGFMSVERISGSCSSCAMHPRPGDPLLARAGGDALFSHRYEDSGNTRADRSDHGRFSRG